MLRTPLALLLLLAIVAFGQADAAVYVEQGDAGQVPDFAQEVVVAGLVDVLEGRIEHAFDADLFRLVIDAPAAFSAAAIQSGTDAPDLQLFLFDSRGNGVVASDNNQFSSLPVIPAGTLVGQSPGVFLLGVSAADHDPRGAWGAIFPENESGISRPAGLSRFDPLLAWSLDYTAVGGNYLVALTAVSGIVPPLPGDYNQDGTVDAADYTVWRDHLGAAARTLPNDIDGGVIGAAQYATWKTNYGQTVLAALAASHSAGVPEPASVALVMLGAAGLAAMRRRHP